ncbi:MAG: general secretion pathway protein GspB [Desulfobacterales bacterium]
MSSILKALKKLENGFSEQREIRPRLQKRLKKKAIHQRVIGTWLYNKRFFIIFAVVILAVGGWLVLNREPREEGQTLVAKTTTKPVESVGIPEKKASIPNMVQQKRPIGKDIEKSEPNAKAAKMKTISPRKLERKAPALFAKKEINPPKPLSHTEKKASVPNINQKEMSTREDEEESEQNIKTERFESIPLKQANETRLEIQAIAWSSDPENRIAVVNSRIVREGGSVEGVFVTNIGKDEIVFRKGGEEWRQLFMLN